MSVDERDRGLLAERARLLARELAAPSEGTRYTAFERRGVRYALDPKFIFEVGRALPPTSLPCAPAHWLGVTSVRGELLPVVDLALLLGAASAERAAAEAPEQELELEEQLVLVLGTAQRELAIVIDGALETVALGEGLARVAHLQGLDASLVLGTAPDGTRVVSAETLLSDPRLFIQAADQPREA